MADSQIVGNVESPLAQSVVDSSTTDVDAATSLTKSAVFGEIKTSSNSIPPAEREHGLPYEAQLLKIPNSPDIKDADSDLDGLSDGMGRDAERRDGAKSAEPDSVAETPTSGSNSPIKTDSGKPIDRKTSTKKPSFKPISLNKQFLKDTVPVSGPTSSLSLSTALQSGKGPSSLPTSSQTVPRIAPASKLKLVRTGASSQVSRPGGSGANGSGGLSRGDQSQPVWNKNKPTLPAPVKELTDEELKKQYGIHLTSRLESDDATNKVAKWADIDDDDDDWVPETIQWNDGTKVTASTDDHDNDSLQETERPTEIRPTVSPPPVQPPPPPQPVVIAKSPAPSAIKESSGRPKTLVTEKATAKSSSTAPPPAVRASPWAKLPPVNPTPPISSSPPRQSPPEPSHLDEPIRDVLNVREVSAEVYDRSWREKGAGQTNRELFNSETGQLEPVHESRNKPVRSNRSDMSMNKPAVLQRPAGPHPPSGPAEPSAAFQQHRSSTTSHYRPEEYRRRRTSSNVSGGSGSIGRRQSFSRYGDPNTPDDVGFLGNRPIYSNPFDDTLARGSQGPGLHGAHQSHQSPTRHFREQVSPTMPVTAPSIPQGESSVPKTTQPQLQLPLPSLTPPPPPSVLVAASAEVEEDPIAQQERIMKEGRELARKRRQEEEEREEAAKKERLRLKLEHLEKVAKEKAEQESAAKRKVEEERLAAEKKIENEKRRQAEEAAEQERLREREREQGQRQQPQPNRYVARQPPLQHPPNGLSASSTSPMLINSHQHAPSLPKSYTSAAPSSDPPAVESSSMPPRSPTKLFANNARGYRDQPWKQQGTSRFESPQQQQQRYGNWLQSAGASSGTGQYNSPWGAIGDKTRNAGQGEGGNTGPDRYGNFGDRSDPVHRNDNRQGQHRGYPTSPGHNSSSKMSQEERNSAVSRWNALPDKIIADEAAERERIRHARMTRDAEEAVTGMRKAPQTQPTIVETFRKVGVDDNRKLVDVKTKEYRPADLSPDANGVMPPMSTTDSNGASTMLGQSNGIPKGPSASRPSRFFPSAAGNPGGPTKQPIASSTRFDPPGSPPPPMSSDHPVHGDNNVRIVQLPPVRGQANTGHTSTSPRTNGLHQHKFDNPKSPRTHSVFDDFEAVQQKILGLTQKHSPPQQPVPSPQHLYHALGPNPKATTREFSSTKPAYEASPERHYKPVNVSLPGNEEKIGLDKRESTLTKPDDEKFFHLLFAQDFGSTPTVRLPNVPSHLYNLGNPQGSSNPAPTRTAKRTGGKYHPHSVDMFSAFVSKDFLTQDGKRFIPVHIPGGDAKEIVYRGPDVRKGKKSLSKRGSHRGNGYTTQFGRGGAHPRKIADLVQ